MLYVEETEWVVAAQVVTVDEIKLDIDIGRNNRNGKSQSETGVKMGISDEQEGGASKRKVHTR